MLAVLLSGTALQAAPLAADSVSHRKKVAVVLSGGGALGAIHVGALKVLEEAGMPVDMVVGTSMGSIVGAFYSVGYNSDDIATMLRTMDWAELFLDHEDYNRLTLSDREERDTYIYERDFYVRGGIDPQPGGLIRGTSVERAFTRYLHGYTDSLNFLRDLPRQFACVATNLVTDSAVTLTRGSLVKSIRSSMSIPGVFTPVHMDDMVLVDGGAKNNFAADVARALGADIVIGVKFDLGLGTDKEYRKLMDVMERSAGSDVSRRARANEKYCDLVVKVPVRGYTSGSFTRSALDSLMAKGEAAMRAKMDSVMILKRLSGAAPSHDYSLHLRDVADAPQNVETDCGLIDTRADKTLQAALGLRFDSEDLAAVQLGARYYRAGSVGRQLDLTMRLGMRSMLRLGFDIEPRQHRRMGLGYEIWYKYTNIYTHGHRTNNLSHMYQKANLKLFSVEAMNFDCEVGLGWEHYHIFSELWNDKSDMRFNRNEHYFNYHARLRYNSENDGYFATRGVCAQASYGYYTDNFARWKGHSGFSAVQALLRVTEPLSRSTHLRPSIYGRFLFGDDLPALMANMAGGTPFGRFFPQQLPLPGLGHVELMESKLVGASLRLQQRITGRHLVLLDGGVAEQSDRVKGLFDDKPMWGVAASYFYDNAFVGPLGLSIGWNSRSHRVDVFLCLGYNF